MWGFRNRTINSHEIQNIRRFFSYFYWGQSAKILQHRKKERLKISEAAKLNSSLLQTYEEIKLRPSLIQFVSSKSAASDSVLSHLASWIVSRSPEVAVI